MQPIGGVQQTCRVSRLHTPAVAADGAGAAEQRCGAARCM